MMQPTTIAALRRKAGKLSPIDVPETKGPTGANGWTPVLAGELDGTRTLIKVLDWTGGEGQKPATGLYIGAAGYAAKAQAFNFNVAKRVMAASAQTNAQGVATIAFGVTFATPPQVLPLPATTPVLSGPTHSTVSNITTTNCQVTVQQQAILTGLLSALSSATANVLIVER